MTNSPLTWSDALAWLQQHASGNVLKMLAFQIQHPKDAGMTVALDVPLGQRTTYRMMLDTKTDLVVRDFGTYYEAFLELRPTMQGLEKTLTESPGSSVAGMVAAGALLGLLFGRSKNSALTGAAIGGLAALAGVAVANAKTSPTTSKIAVDLLKTMQEMPIPLDEPVKPKVLSPAPTKPTARKKVSRATKRP